MLRSARSTNSETPTTKLEWSEFACDYCSSILYYDRYVKELDRYYCDNTYYKCRRDLVYHVRTKQVVDVTAQVRERKRSKGLLPFKLFFLQSYYDDCKSFLTSHFLLLGVHKPFLATKTACKLFWWSASHSSNFVTCSTLQGARFKVESCQPDWKAASSFELLMRSSSWRRNKAVLNDVN